MYPQRTKNIPVYRGCDFRCVYCNFKRLVQLNKKCSDCTVFKPHAHMEVLQRTPPRTKEGEFLTVGLSGDVSFMNVDDFWQVIEYCRKWKDRTFMIQSKNPAYFSRFQEFIAPLRFPDNLILGTTIETNKEYLYNAGTGVHTSCSLISKAPLPQKRYEAMLELTSRTAVTIEPLLDFDIKVMEDWICQIQPAFLYIGYANDGKNGARLRLPEPEVQKTHELIDRLRRNTYGTEIREKTIREAWYE